MRHIIGNFSLKQGTHTIKNSTKAKRERNHYRSLRRKARRMLSQGKVDLRVAKQGKEYILIVERKDLDGRLVSLGQKFKKQSDAIAHGEEMFGIKARRIVKEFTIAA